MKYFILGWVFAGLVSCGGNENRFGNEMPFGARSIIGNWELAETRISPGGPVDWSPAEHRDTYVFAIDGTYVYTNLSNDAFSHKGTFTAAENKLTLHYVSSEGTKKSVAYYMAVEGGEMILNYLGCIEVCSLKFIGTP